MSTAPNISTHDHTIVDDVLTQVRRTYPELDAQDAFLLPKWFYGQNCWVEDSLDSENSLYNLPIAVRITGSLDIAILRKSLFEVQRRQDVLRSVFRSRSGQIFQIVVPPRDVGLEVVDLTDLRQSERDAQLARGMSEEANRPFVLATEMLLRARLFRLGVAEYVLQLTTHHIVCDDWSSGILIKELFALYDNLAEGSGGPLPVLTFHYGDFIKWQQRRARGDARRQAVWKTKLTGSHGFYHVRPDSPRPPRRTSRSGTISYSLSAQLEAALRGLAQSNKVTFFMALLAGFQSMLHLVSGDVDVGVATCAANRPLPAVENLVGRFANDLLVRTDYSGDPSFGEILSRTCDAALEGYSYQDVPFGGVLEDLVPVTNPGDTPLFQSMFILQNAPTIKCHTGAINAERMLFDTQMAKYDLAVWLRMEKGLDITFEYSRDLFREETIARMMKDYEAVLEAMVVDPDKRVSEIRRTLLRMHAEPRGSSSSLNDYTPDVSQEIETELMALWKEVLGVIDIRVTDDFFEVGGDSLRATQLLQRVKQRFGAELLLSSLFSSRTIKQQSLAIAKQSACVGGSEKELRSADESCGHAVNDCRVAERSVFPPKSMLRRASNRILHILSRFLPGATTVRPFLHRLRGMKIGKDVWIGDDAYLENEYPELVEIHDGAVVGLRSIIIAHTRGKGQVVIGKDVYIGAGCVIATTANRKLVIGEGSVIIASSLVTGNVAPNTLYGSDASKPLARIGQPFTASASYEEFMTTLRPLS